MAVGLERGAEFRRVCWWIERNGGNEQMNLQKLFETQAALDANITEKHPVQPGEDRLAKKILALLVELGECANEYRVFKFWSTDQEPRVAKLLEEYVDCLHFVLSIGLERGFTWEQVETAYFAKNQVNHERQERGY